MTRQVLILGGGYGGVYAALGAARARGDAAVDITLVSAEPDLVNRPRLYESGPGEHIRYPLAPMLERIHVGFRLARVTGIDVEARRVALAEGPPLGYDRLVIALGSRLERPALPGIERAFDVDSYEAARALDRHLQTLPPGAPVTVVGSGFTASSWPPSWPSASGSCCWSAPTWWRRAWARGRARRSPARSTS